MSTSCGEVKSWAFTAYWPVNIPDLVQGKKTCKSWVAVFCHMWTIPEYLNVSNIKRNSKMSQLQNMKCYFRTLRFIVFVTWKAHQTCNPRNSIQRNIRSLCEFPYKSVSSQGNKMETAAEELPRNYLNNNIVRDLRNVYHLMLKQTFYCAQPR